MGIALTWWEGQFFCEFKDDTDGWTLRIFTDGELLWQEPVRSATAASRRARELTAWLWSRVKEA